MMQSDTLSLSSLAWADLILFSAQVLLVFIVVCVSLFNLTYEYGNQNLWTVVLTGSLGYLMPNPRLKQERPAEPTGATR